MIEMKVGRKRNHGIQTCSKLHWRALLNTNHKILFILHRCLFSSWGLVVLFGNLLIIAIDTAFNAQFYYCHANVKQHVSLGIYIRIYSWEFYIFFHSILVINIIMIVRVIRSRVFNIPQVKHNCNLFIEWLKNKYHGKGREREREKQSINERLKNLSR